ncbi:hypothetical protein IWZ03DRAFT_436704 [Phyllosticta citriasiana]|uniref:Uncharacterized protein n=1 Tax=Phyllosticta citriasiana TaxID=595635 RepID=A0ABR1KAA6_9PEZI
MADWPDRMEWARPDVFLLFPWRGRRASSQKLLRARIFSYVFFVLRRLGELTECMHTVLLSSSSFHHFLCPSPSIDREIPSAYLSAAAAACYPDVFSASNEPSQALQSCGSDAQANPQQCIIIIIIRRAQRLLRNQRLQGERRLPPQPSDGTGPNNQSRNHLARPRPQHQLRPPPLPLLLLHPFAFFFFLVFRKLAAGHISPPRLSDPALRQPHRLWLVGPAWHARHGRAGPAVHAPAAQGAPHIVADLASGHV